MQTVPTWKKVTAFILDLIVSFFVFGYAVALLTGNTTSGGFNLNGGPAFLVFALVIGYFVVTNKYLGGTLFKRVFGIARKNPSTK